MLEFIVLGQIPGTSVQITFAQVLIVASALLLVSEYRIVLQRKSSLKNEQNLITKIAL